MHTQNARGKNLRGLLFLLPVLLCGAALVFPQEKPKLYQRLGGYDTLSAIVGWKNLSGMLLPSRHLVRNPSREDPGGVGEVCGLQST